MNKFLLFILCFLSTLTIFAQKDGYDITVKIDGLSDTSELLLAHHFGDKQYLKDTSTFENGAFHFKGPERLKTGVYLIVLPKKNWFELIVSKDENQMKYTFSTDTLLNPGRMVTGGSKENAAFYEFNKFAADLGVKATKMNKEMQATEDEKKKEKLLTELRAMGKTVADRRHNVALENKGLFIATLYNSMREVEIPEFDESLSEEVRREKAYYYKRAHYFDNIDKSEDGMVLSPKYHEKLKDFFENYVPPVPDTAIMLADKVIADIEKGGSKEQFKYTVHYLLGYFEKSEYMCFDKGLHHMAKNYYCAGKAFWSDSAFVAKMCEESAKMEPTLCGKTAPDMFMPDSTFILKNQKRLSQVKTPVTVVVMWDIKCGHCKKEMPIISSFYDSADKSQVEVYAVYTQSDWDGWKKRLRKEKFKFINVGNAFGQDKFRDHYNIITTPQIYVLDKDKKIRFKKIGAKDIPGVVDFLLKDQGIIEDPDNPEKPEGSKQDRKRG